MTVSARPDVAVVGVGDEFVLLDGWDSATCINRTGALIWSMLGGGRTVASVTSELAAASGADPDRVAADVTAFVSNLAQQGLVEGYLPEPEPGLSGLVLTGVPIIPAEVGDRVDNEVLTDLAGTPTPLLETQSPTVLLNWNPHCGYCARIAHRLAGWAQALSASGHQLVLVATGGPDTNRDLVDAAGFNGPLLLQDDDRQLFRFAGTPTAYHVDAEGVIVSPPAYGAEEVTALLNELSGLDDRPSDADAGVRYLLDRDGLCGATPAGGTAVTWAGVAVHRVGDFHVGVRYNSPATADLLSQLLPDSRVEDPWAGHSYSLALMPDSPDDAPTNGGPRALNLLVQATQPPVRSRDRARVLQALLVDLSDRTGGQEARPHQIQVDAVAVAHAGGIALLPFNVHWLGPRLQALLAGISLPLADHRYPFVDLETAEVILPAPTVHHDPQVLQRLTPPDLSRSECPAVGPGRYPLTDWFVPAPTHNVMGPLTPGQAAAATLSLVRHTVDAPGRLRELGVLFERVNAHGLWFSTDQSFCDALSAVLAPAPKAHR